MHLPSVCREIQREINSQVLLSAKKSHSGTLWLKRDVNYENASGCEGGSPASNTINLNERPSPTFITAPSGPVCIGQEYTYTTQL